MLNVLKANNKVKISFVVILLIVLFFLRNYLFGFFWVTIFIFKPSSQKVQSEIINLGEYSYNYLLLISKSVKIENVITDYNPYWNFVRENSIKLMCKIDYQKSIPFILNLLKYEKDLEIIELYAQIFKNSNILVRRKIILQLNDPSEQTRRNAIKILTKIKENEAIMPIINLLRNDNSRDVKSAAAEYLGDFKDKRAVEPLMNELSDNSSSISKYIIIRSLVLIGDDRARNNISDYYKNEKNLTFWRSKIGFLNFCIKNGSVNIKRDAIEWLQNNMYEKYPGYFQKQKMIILLY